MKEIWKEIGGNREIYEISNLGHARTKDRIGARGYQVKGHDLVLQDNSNGYLRCGMNLDGKPKSYLIHRLVAEQFVLNPYNKPFVNHIDGNKHNNMVENLEWCTKSENELHAHKIGLHPNRGTKGEKHGMHKLTKEQVDYIRANHVKYDKNNGSKPLAKSFGVRPQTITDIVNNRTWKEVKNGNSNK